MAWNVDVSFETSGTHGMGVFARRRILAGTKVWQFDETMHLCDRDGMAAMHPEQITFALHGGYLHTPSGMFLWYEDGMQFLNHGFGSQANVGLHYWPKLGEDHIVALRDIAPGEELLEDYTFCLDGGLAPDHWMRPFYLKHCPHHLDFLLSLEDLRVAA